MRTAVETAVLPRRLSGAQIQPSNVVVVKQLRPRAGELDLPGHEDEPAVGHGQSLFDVLLDQQDCRSEVSELSDAIEHLIDVLRFETDRGLVKQHHFRFENHGACCYLSCTSPLATRHWYDLIPSLRAG